MTTERHRPPILKPNEFYTFHSYFQMKFAPADILRELGVTLTKSSINLPVAASELLTRLPNLRQRLEEAIAHLYINSISRNPWRSLFASSGLYLS